jgi:hypothetical protein
MVCAQVDRSATLLRVSYAGRVSPDETKGALENVESLLNGLEPGFRLLADLSGLETMDLTCVPHLKRMMDACNKKSVDTVVRVIPDPHKDIGLNILSLFHYPRRVRIVTCEKLDEALKVLAG